MSSSLACAACNFMLFVPWKSGEIYLSPFFLKVMFICVFKAGFVNFNLITPKNRTFPCPRDTGLMSRTGFGRCKNPLLYDRMQFPTISRSCLEVSNQHQLINYEHNTDLWQDEDSLSKILSNVYASHSQEHVGMNTTSPVRESASEIQENTLFGFHAKEKSANLDRRWTSDNKGSKFERDHDPKALIFRAQQQFTTVEVLLQHLKHAMRKPYPERTKRIARPTTASSNKANPQSKLPAGQIDEVTVQSELLRTFEILKDLHQRLRDALEAVEIRENRTREKEQATITPAQSDELLHFAAEIPKLRGQIAAKSTELTSREEALGRERDLLIRSVGELKAIRARVEAKDVRVQQDAAAAAAMRAQLQADLRAADAARRDLDERQRLQEERARLLENGELELARGRLELSEREDDLRLRALALQAMPGASPGSVSAALGPTEMFSLAIAHIPQRALVKRWRTNHHITTFSVRSCLFFIPIAFHAPLFGSGESVALPLHPHFCPPLLSSDPSHARPIMFDASAFPALPLAQEVKAAISDELRRWEAELAARSRAVGSDWPPGPAARSRAAPGSAGAERLDGRLEALLEVRGYPPLPLPNPRAGPAPQLLPRAT